MNNPKNKLVVIIMAARKYGLIIIITNNEDIFIMRNVLEIMSKLFHY
jgi:hypothetical protein